MSSHVLSLKSQSSIKFSSLKQDLSPESSFKSKLNLTVSPSQVTNLSRVPDSNQDFELNLWSESSVKSISYFKSEINLKTESNLKFKSA